MIRLTFGFALTALAIAPATSVSAQEPTVSLTDRLYVSAAQAIAVTEAAPDPADVVKDEAAPAAADAKPAAEATVTLANVKGSGRAELDAMIARHAAANGVPLELAHRVVVRESRYNSRAISKGNYGLMQIRLGTARALGYRGDVSGLLDPETNLTYAMKYLAGAYKVAGGNHGRAVSYYASGYYYAAKRQGLTRSADATH